MICLAQLMPSAIPANPSQWTFYCISLAVAGALAWFLTQRRTIADIDKLKAEKLKLDAEIANYAGVNLKELQRTREAHSAACQNCKRSAQKISTLMTKKASPNDILIAREEFCNFLAKDAFDTYSAHVEWQTLSLKVNEAALKEYLEDDVREELSRMSKWITVLNSPTFLEGVEATPIEDFKTELTPIL